MGGHDEDQLMWLEEDAEDVELQPQLSAQAALPSSSQAAAENDHGAAVAALEDELQRTRKELMDVRKELAAKTVQLSRKEVVVAQERVAELAASVSGEKDKQLASLATHIEQLEAVLGQKEEELEESRRMYAAQKRALREALAAAAEAEAAERQADEARARTAVAQAVEDELEQLQHELALLQARYDLEMRARDAELQSLRQELAAANTNRKQAVAAAEAALTEAWQAEVCRATEAAEARVGELEGEVARVRQQLEEQARSSDAVTLAGELAALNQQKVAIQREFDAFRDLATAAARQNREDSARLLEENAALKGRLAARAFQDVQAGFKPQTKVFTALTSPGGLQPGSAGDGAGGAPGLGSWGDLPAVLAQWERQRKGLIPLLLIGSLVALLMLLAVVRAAAATRSEHRGGLCFLAHLGINVGKGCGLPSTTVSVASAATEELEAMLETAPRVHDVEATEVVAAAGVAEAAAAVVDAAVGLAAGTATEAAGGSSGAAEGGAGGEKTRGDDGAGVASGALAGAGAVAGSEGGAAVEASSGDAATSEGRQARASDAGDGNAEGGGEPVTQATGAGGAGSAAASTAAEKAGAAADSGMVRRARSVLSKPLALPLQRLRLWVEGSGRRGASRRLMHPAWRAAR